MYLFHSHFLNVLGYFNISQFWKPKLREILPVVPSCINSEIETRQSQEQRSHQYICLDFFL